MSATTHQPDASAHGLDWIDRSICAYLVLPLLLFCLWFTTPVATALLALSVYGIYRALRRGEAGATGIPPRWLFAIAALSFGWVAIAGVGHFFYANADWVIRDAVLHDLSIASWPTTYAGPDSSSFILRAPIAYFLPAGALGQLAGPVAADFALYLSKLEGRNRGYGVFPGPDRSLPQRLADLAMDPHALRREDGRGVSLHLLPGPNPE